MDEGLDEDLVFEVKFKPILHFNSRNFSSFPEELKHFGQETQEIYLKWNFITILPDWLSLSLQNLTNLYLSHNFLMHFPVPLCHLKQLEVLHLDNNCIYGVEEIIGNLQELVELNISNNILTTLPSAMGNLGKLRILLVTDNQLNFLPEELAQCWTLEQLALDRNHLTHLPRGLVCLPQLQYLGLSNNRLTHLPALPFISTPTISLAGNPQLYWIAASVLRKSAEECGFWKKHICTNMCCKMKLHVPIKNLFNDEAPSLLELSLRTVYKYLVPPHNSIMETLTLPVNLQKILQQGPVSECMHCQSPVFLQALVYVSHLAADSQLPTHCLAFYCSIHCARTSLKF